MKNRTELFFVDNGNVVSFAVKETARYLKKITGNDVVCCKRSEYDQDINGVWICAPGMSVPVDEWNDVIEINARRGHVRLSGSNSRSVLFAVYDWLEQLGCCWLRPGRFGEKIPVVQNPLLLSVNKYETASYKHRCICIEGSCSQEHVLDLIDFAAKKKFNAYFIQFRNSYTFFKRWYGLEKNRYEKVTPFSVEEADRICKVIKAEVLKRGMVLHMVGHGWTCETFGIPGLEWAPFDSCLLYTSDRCRRSTLCRSRWSPYH